MQRDAWYKTWYMRGVSYAILMVRNSCSVSYLLPSPETFHSVTTEKAFTYSWTLPHVVRDKQKMMQRNSCTTQPKQIFMVLIITKTFALFLELCARKKTTPHFLDDESGKNFHLIFE
jgi:hypothetical protein